MTSVAVQSLVIDPIWKTESAVASTPVAVLSTPAAASMTSPSASTADGGAGHAVLREQAGQALAEPGVDLSQVRHGPRLGGPAQPALVRRNKRDRPVCPLGQPS